MTNDSTLSLSKPDQLLKKQFSPKPKTINFIRQYARVYSFLGEGALASCIVN